MPAANSLRALVADYAAKGADTDESSRPSTIQDPRMTPEALPPTDNLATVTPGFVERWMGIFNGGPSLVDLGVLPTLWTLTGPLYIGGGVLFGIATFRAGVLPRWVMAK